MAAAWRPPAARRPTPSPASPASAAARAYLGKVADDQLGEIFAHDMRAIGAHFATAPLVGGPATGRCLINVTPDGQRTMCTFLGASVRAHRRRRGRRAVDRGAKIVYLEGYLFDPPRPRARLRQGRGPGPRRGPADRTDASPTPSWSSATAPACWASSRAEVDVLFANEAEICALFETDDFDAAVDALRSRRASIAAVTRGARGLGDPGQRRSGLTVDGRAGGESRGHHRRRRPIRGGVPVRPRRGAGRWQQCGRLGSLAAAEVISHYGPRPQVSLKDLAAAKGLLEPMAADRRSRPQHQGDPDPGRARSGRDRRVQDLHRHRLLRPHAGELRPPRRLRPARSRPRATCTSTCTTRWRTPASCSARRSAKALDGFKGVRRFGHAYIPMDETLTRCAIDLSNRPYLIWKVNFSTPEGRRDGHRAVQGIPPRLRHELRAPACTSRPSTARTRHHIAESGFKALARALRDAVELDPKTGGHAPSTKGVL